MRLPFSKQPIQSLRLLQILLPIIILVFCLWFWTFRLNVVYILHTSESREQSSISVDHYLVKPYWYNTGYSLLPDLGQINWPGIEYAPEPVAKLSERTGRPIPHPPAFLPVFSRGQRKLVFRLLDVFAKVLSDNGFGDRFIINAGSLHGSLRHHDIIPYDDDVDICVERTAWSKIPDLLRSHAPDYIIYSDHRRAKFFTREIPPELQATDAEYSRNTSKYPWLWPSIDICFYTNNETHVFEVGANESSRTWPISVFFPLLFRPFGRQWYPTPFNPIQYIRTMVPQDHNCFRPGYCHVFEEHIKRQTIPCIELASRYAFVQRSRVQNVSIVFPADASASVRRLVVGEERLVLLSGKDKAPTVIHTIQLPVHLDLATLDTYNYGTNKKR